MNEKQGAGGVGFAGLLEWVTSEGECGRPTREETRRGAEKQSSKRATQRRERSGSREQTTTKEKKHPDFSGFYVLILLGMLVLILLGVLY